MRWRISHLATALLVSLPGPVSAFWRLPCKAPIVVQRADPIMSPGTVSSHAHTVMGSSGFGFDMTYADTQNATCSSCIVTKDMSNYWVPNLYYMAKNGSFIHVGQNGGATIYYLQRSDPKDPEYSNGLLAFPEGFRMMAGNPLLRNYTDTVEQQAISYACLGVSGPETHAFPTQNCPDGIRQQIFFPSCWNGVDLDSLDHKSHMAYPSRYDSGFCPPTHPKRFISIFYEIIWNTPDFADMWYDGSQPFVLSNGDNTGYGNHGDFVNGWDVPTLQRAVNECNSASGVIEECKVFNFFTDNFAQGCKIPTSIDEIVTGVLDALPGCNPIQSGPGMAKAAAKCNATSTIGNPEYNFVDLTISKGFEYIGCGADIAGQARTLDGASFEADDMTNANCVDFCVSKGFSIAGTEFAKQCYCGNSVPADRAPVPGLMGNCFMPCSGNNNEMCGGGGLISLYQKCGSTCHNAVIHVNNRTSSSDSMASGSYAGPTYPAATSSVVISATVSRSSTVSSIMAASAVAAVGHSSAPSSKDTTVVVVIETRTVIPVSSVPSPTSAGLHPGGHTSSYVSSSEDGTYTVTTYVTQTTTVVPGLAHLGAAHTKSCSTTVTALSTMLSVTTVSHAHSHGTPAHTHKISAHKQHQSHKFQGSN